MQRSALEAVCFSAFGTAHSYTLILFRDKKFFPDKWHCSPVAADYGRIDRSGHSVFFAFVINRFQNSEDQFLSASCERSFPFLISAHIL